MIVVGERNEVGNLLLFDTWANEPNCRIQIWQLTNGDVRIDFVDGQVKHAAGLTMTSERARDFRVMLELLERQI